MQVKRRDRYPALAGFFWWQLRPQNPTTQCRKSSPTVASHARSPLSHICMWDSHARVEEAWYLKLQFWVRGLFLFWSDWFLETRWPSLGKYMSSFRCTRESHVQMTFSNGAVVGTQRKWGNQGKPSWQPQGGPRRTGTVVWRHAWGVLLAFMSPMPDSLPGVPPSHLGCSWQRLAWAQFLCPISCSVAGRAGLTAFTWPGSQWFHEVTSVQVRWPREEAEGVALCFVLFHVSCWFLFGLVFFIFLVVSQLPSFIWKIKGLGQLIFKGVSKSDFPGICFCYSLAAHQL